MPARAKSSAGRLRAQSQQALPVVVVDAVIESMVRDLQGLLHGASVPEQKTFLQSFIKRVTTTDKKVDIAYLMPRRPV